MDMDHITTECGAHEKSPRGREKNDLCLRVLLPEHTPMFHLVQYVVVGEAVPNGLLHLSLIISCHSLLFMKGCLLLEQNNSFAW